MLKDARKDGQTADASGPLRQPAIAGVALHRSRNIVTGNGVTTEAFRPEWGLDPHGVDHIIHVQLRAHAVSAWHMHEQQVDRIFVTDGTIRVVLFDDREDSPSRGLVDVFNLGRMDPAIVSIPSGVWHGLQNLEASTSSFLNYFNRRYRYEDPDEWRLPADTTAIPYRFK